MDERQAFVKYWANISTLQFSSDDILFMDLRVMNMEAT